MGQKLGKTKDEIEKKFNDKKAAAAVVPPAASSSGSGGGKKSTLTPNENQQHPSGTITSGVRSMTLPNPPPSTLTASLQPSSTQASASAPVPAPASTQVPFAAPTSVATTTVPSGMKQSTSGDFSHYNSKLTIDDFDLLKVLGKGSFGKVMLVKRKGDDAQHLYAMKTLRKAALIKRNQLAHTSTERTILQKINNPFLVHLIFAFQTTDKLYMVLDYMAGGELFFWLKKDRKFSEPRVQLYTAEITIAIEALHSADIVYRDLKPENILLDSIGHLRLTDFGLAKGGITGYGSEGGTKTFCGTPEYLAPEILENKGHGKGVDWWALGTLVFEMLTGLPPYYDTNVQRMYHKILHEPLRFPKGNTPMRYYFKVYFFNKHNLSIPSDLYEYNCISLTTFVTGERLQMSEQAKDLLRGMLERKVSDRVGCTMGGANDIKSSSFFEHLDFTTVLNRGYTPEFKPPSANSLTDVRNFDTEFTSELAADSMVVTHMTDTMQEKTRFDGFTYEDNRMK